MKTLPSPARRRSSKNIVRLRVRRYRDIALVGTGLLTWGVFMGLLLFNGTPTVSNAFSSVRTTGATPPQVTVQTVAWSDVPGISWSGKGLCEQALQGIGR